MNSRSINSDMSSNELTSLGPWVKTCESDPRSNCLIIDNRQDFVPIKHLANDHIVTVTLIVAILPSNMTILVSH